MYIVGKEHAELGLAKEKKFHAQGKSQRRHVVMHAGATADSSSSEAGHPSARRTKG
jgi:hypothetical protein